MGIYKKINELCSEQKLSISVLEQELGFSKGSISKWKRSMPSAAHLIKTADYFDISTDYLLGRSSIRARCPDVIDEEFLGFIVKFQKQGLDKEALSAILNVIVEKYK